MQQINDADEMQFPCQPFFRRREALSNQLNDLFGEYQKHLYIGLYILQSNMPIFFKPCIYNPIFITAYEEFYHAWNGLSCILFFSL